jgi:putative MATE family efflux protein
MPIPKAVAQLSIPMVVGSLVMILYNLADTFFVGMLNDPIQTAGVTLAAPILLAFNAVNNLFGVGASSMMSRAMGRKDYETVYKSSAFAFWCAIFSGLLFSVACTVFKNPLLQLLGANETTIQATANYMFWTVTCGAVPSILNVVIGYMIRSEGAALHASIGTMSGCILNIILDPIFILPWGLNMGAAGAGCATLVANIFACMYFIVLLYVKRKSTLVCISPKKFSFDPQIVGGICAVGIPACIQNLLNVVGMTILNNKMASFGPDPVAAMGIVQKINMIPLQVVLGASQGIMPLVSYNYASRNHQRMKDAYMCAIRIALVFCFVVVAGYYFFAGNLIGFFMENPVVVDIGTKLLRGFCLGLPFLCVDFISVGVFQAVGMGKHALVFAITRKIVLEIPAIFVLNHFFPLYGLAYTQFVAELVMCTLSLIVLIRLFNRLKKEGEE